MSSSIPNQPSSSFQPFTQTDVAASSFTDIFDNMSSNDFNQESFFTEKSQFSSFQASLASKVTNNFGSTTLTTSRTSATVASSATGASAASTGASASSGSTPAQTAASDSAAASASSATSSASSSAANNATSLSQSGSGLSSGTQAAIAVPVVLVALAAIILAVFCIRRRKKKREEAGDAVEKAPLAVRKKKWTRHLRIFSFDSELLMGGRYSSTNSIRSRQTGSMRSQASHRSQSASVHSIEEIAPPYRDAISSAQPPNIGQVIAAPLAAGGLSRSASSATAPPPYGVAAGRVASPTTPTSAQGRQNPFADSLPVSPIDGSPFNDPPGTSPPISRNSSVYHTDRDDASTIGAASDAGSIRQATLARNASVMSGGRIINNVNRS